MRAFDPASSFGPETAAQYDGFVRGDEEAAAAFLLSKICFHCEGEPLQAVYF
jgi:hypothetical protein